MNKSKRYSFFHVRKDVVFVPDGISKEQYSDIAEDDFQDTMIYDVNDRKIVEEYCFANGDCSLYRDDGNDTLSVLFSRMSNPDGNTYTVFQPDGIYLANKEGVTFSSVIFMTAKDFYYLYNIANHPVPQKLYSLRDLISDYYTSKHSIPVVMDGSIVEGSQLHYDRFKKNFMKYSMASEYIPASVTLQNLSKQIIHYTATRELDEEAFLADFTNLQNFQELCAKSIDTLCQFINRTPKTDLRHINEQLQQTNKNISNIIDIYLEEELEKER